MLSKFTDLYHLSIPGLNPSTFKELDTDGNGLINSYEFINFRTFQEIDGNGDGSIDHDEYINNGGRFRRATHGRTSQVKF